VEFRELERHKPDSKAINLTPLAPMAIGANYLGSFRASAGIPSSSLVVICLR